MKFERGSRSSRRQQTVTAATGTAAEVGTVVRPSSVTNTTIIKCYYHIPIILRIQLTIVILLLLRRTYIIVHGRQQPTGGCTTGCRHWYTSPRPVGPVSVSTAWSGSVTASAHLSQPYSPPTRSPCTRGIADRPRLWRSFDGTARVSHNMAGRWCGGVVVVWYYGRGVRFDKI